MSEADRRARVRRVVALGARLADPADALGAEARARLAATSGLSREGVDLALGEHLETSITDAQLDTLVRGAGRAPRCHVVLAANVCVGALRAVALAVATAASVAVRPSRRDPALAEILVRELARDEGFAGHGGAVEIVVELDPTPGDELHVYGADSTIAAFAAALGPDVLLRGHGTGLGVAIVGAADDLDAAARAIARDVVPFDQRGCLSPRAVLVEGDAGRAESLAERLHAELDAFDRAVPRGELERAALAELALYRTAIEAIGRFLPGAGHAVGVDPAPRALATPPAARVVHVAAVHDAGELRALLAPWAPAITVVGAAGTGALAAEAAALAPGARRAELGRMQRPPLDGPVDRRHATR